MELRLGSVSEFFQEAVSEAMRNQGVDTSPITESYLVNLLGEFLTHPITNDALGVKLAASTLASPEERIRQLKDVGDTSLYVTGFFSDSLARRLLDVDYYIQMGGTAYGQLARHYRDRPEFSDVYFELGINFPRFVDVLAEVSETSQLTTNTGVVQLYERWLRTGSEWIARRLRQRGVIPGSGESH
jgi:hypothetical protein